MTVHRNTNFNGLLFVIESLNMMDANINGFTVCSLVMVIVVGKVLI